MATKKATTTKLNTVNINTTATTNTVSMKGETTMKNTNTNIDTTAQEVITVTLNLNTEREGLEIRFSGYPKAVIKNQLVALKFRYYPALGNAWIKKIAKVPEESLKKFIRTCIRQDYKIVSTKDGKSDAWINKYVKAEAKAVKKEAKEIAKEEISKVVDMAEKSSAPILNNNAVMNAMIALLKENGYSVTKAEKPVTEAPKTEAKTEAKPKATRKPRTKKAETPKAEAPKEEPKPKAEEPKKLEAKAIPVSNNKKTPKAEKKLFVNGIEVERLF